MKSIEACKFEELKDCWRDHLRRFEHSPSPLVDEYCEDIIRELPVIDPEQLPTVDVLIRDAVWATRTTDAMMLPAIEESSSFALAGTHQK